MKNIFEIGDTVELDRELEHQHPWAPTYIRIGNMNVIKTFIGSEGVEVTKVFLTEPQINIIMQLPLDYRGGDIDLIASCYLKLIKRSHQPLAEFYDEYYA